MALPPDIQKRKIREKIIGLDGKAKISEINNILKELPNYNTGPYGDMKKWLREEIEKSKTRSNIKHQDWLGVVRQGDKQFCLVGAPSVGKSSLLSKLSGMNIKTAAYDFTTLKPIPAIIKLNSAQIQIVDLPGLVEGAVDDVGGGKRLIGIVKNTDGIIFMVDLTKPIDKAVKIMNEIKKAKINKPIIIIGNKVDISEAKKNIKALKYQFGKELILISTLTSEGLDVLKERIWNVSNLIRVYTETSSEPMILEKGVNIEDFILKIHKKLLDGFKEAVINGPSAKFPNQKVGLTHILEDNDNIKIISKS